jgi:hypothetical protein
MDEILNARIKELINRYPEVGQVLNDFGVACVTCAVGTCLLKDILNIHRLSPEDEQRMMARIEGVYSQTKNFKQAIHKAEKEVERLEADKVARCTLGRLNKGSHEGPEDGGGVGRLSPHPTINHTTDSFT